MNSICKFSVLRYIPSEEREEFINIGLVLHSPKDGYINFKSTNNFSRVTTFDDEIDISFLKLVLDGVKEEFTQSTVHGPSLQAISDEYFLEKQTSYYANQLQFSPIKIIRSNNPEKDFQDLFRTYVYFDVKKNNRITDDQVKSIMNRVFRDAEVYDKLHKNHRFKIDAEEVILDYSYTSKENATKFIKTLSFDYTLNRSKQATQLAKEWAWNFMKIHELTTNSTVSRSDLLTVVYIRESNAHIDQALKILKDESIMIPVQGKESIEDFANQLLTDLQ